MIGEPPSDQGGDQARVICLASMLVMSGLAGASGRPGLKDVKHCLLEEMQNNNLQLTLYQLYFITVERNFRVGS